MPKPSSRHVILKGVEGWAVYNVGTGARESRFWPSARGKILEDLAAIKAGITPRSYFEESVRRRGKVSLASGLFLGPHGSVVCARHIPLPEDRPRGQRWRELSTAEVRRLEARSGEELLCEEWELHG